MNWPRPYNSIQAAIAEPNVFEVIDDGYTGVPDARSHRLQQVQGRCFYERCLFLRIQTGKTILKGILPMPQAGCKIALVGATGAGKNHPEHAPVSLYGYPVSEIAIDGHPGWPTDQTKQPPSIHGIVLQGQSICSQNCPRKYPLRTPGRYSMKVSYRRPN